MRKIWVLLGVAALFAVGLVGVTQTATADIDNYQIVSNTQQVEFTQGDGYVAGLNATCPSGTSVLGGGGAVTASTPDVAMFSSTPFINGGGWAVRFRDAELGYNFSAQVTAYAICGTP